MLWFQVGLTQVKLSETAHMKELRGIFFLFLFPFFSGDPNLLNKSEVAFLDKIAINESLKEDEFPQVMVHELSEEVWDLLLFRKFVR